jgi:hypothetical protein
LAAFGSDTDLHIKCVGESARKLRLSAVCAMSFAHFSNAN